MRHDAIFLFQKGKPNEVANLDPETEAIFAWWHPIVRLECMNPSDKLAFLCA